MSSRNGANAPTTDEKLRWLWFGGSILSDWSNPLATTSRVVIRALQQLGHRVEYLEPADHPAFHGALRATGSGFYREFHDHYPDIRYRRVTLPRPPERDVWLSREAALVDVLIVESSAPEAVFDWLDRLPESRLVRVLLAESEQERGTAFDLIVRPTGAGSDGRELVDRLTDGVAAARSRRLVRE